MSTTTIKAPRGYEEDFDTEWFLSTNYGRVEGDKFELLRKFYLDFFHDTFSSGNVEGDKLLDLGTGPTIHSVISASPHVKEIHLSDFIERNRQVVQTWLDGAENVPAIFEYLLKKENKGESVKSRNKMMRKKVKKIYHLDLTKQCESIESRNKMMRKKVKKIYHLDLQQEQPFAEFNAKYDVVTSSLCLDVAARNKEEHRVILSKVAGMMNPDGYLAMVGVLDRDSYIVGEFQFPCLNIAENELKSNLKEAGFVIKEWQVKVREIIGVETAGFLFSVLAQKI